MTKDELLKNIRTLGIWKKRSQRAPHKPLLILLYLGRRQTGQPRMGLFEEVEPKLTALLEEFGPTRKNYTPEEPFCRLRADGIWELSVDLPAGVALSKTKLRAQKVAGGFLEEVEQLLKSEDSLIDQVATFLLREHFPSTLHEAILTEIGLDIDSIEDIEDSKKRKKVRDPEFRQRILQAYDYRCAVCNFDVRLGKQPIALEAAHIQWFNHGGPDTVNNGVALCSMHHELLDRGAIGISPDSRLLVSEKVTGYAGLQEWILDYEGKPLNQPRRIEYTLNHEFADWHIREVFKGEYREQAST
ncbi:MAG: HNH endonuclease [Thiolinea sp.]